jgi:phage shock protein A
MSLRSYSSLLGVLLGFVCVFPLLRKREAKSSPATSEVLLHLAQQQMREVQAKNRARAVEAITQKNNLQALADQTQKRVDRLTEQINSADDETKQELLALRRRHAEALAKMQKSLASAIETSENVKLAMRGEEERIRAMTAEALALRIEEKQAQIEIEIAKARLARKTNLATDLFVQAREKIKQTKAQRDLITQIAQTVETLDAAAQEAEATGNRALHQKLAASRDALRDSALNSALWKT